MKGTALAPLASQAIRRDGTVHRRHDSSTKRAEFVGDKDCAM
jgi:hypothetical protein